MLLLLKLFRRRLGHSSLCLLVHLVPNEIYGHLSILGDAGARLLVLNCRGLGAQDRDLLESVAVARVVCHFLTQVFLETLAGLFFPKVAHRLSRALWNEHLALNLEPKSGASRCVL